MKFDVRGDGILGGSQSPRGSRVDTMGCGGVSGGVRGPTSRNNAGDCGPVDTNTGVGSEAEALAVAPDAESTPSGCCSRQAYVVLELLAREDESLLV